MTRHFNTILSSVFLLMVLLPSSAGAQCTSAWYPEEMSAWNWTPGCQAILRSLL